MGALGAIAGIWRYAVTSADTDSVKHTQPIQQQRCPTASEMRGILAQHGGTMLTCNNIGWHMTP